jgi:putative addiction module antidote
MTAPLKLVAIGDSTGVILPKETLARLNIKMGDDLYITETPSGFQLSPFDGKFAPRMEVAGRVVRRYRDARKLA